MNTQSDNTPESAGVSAPGYNASPTQPFLWSVRRELWENRSIYVAPLIVAAVGVFGSFVGSFHLPDRTSGTKHPFLEVASGFGPYNRPLESHHSAGCSAAHHLPDHCCDAIQHDANQ